MKKVKFIIEEIKIKPVDIAQAESILSKMTKTERADDFRISYLPEIGKFTVEQLLNSNWQRSGELYDSQFDARDAALEKTSFPFRRSVKIKRVKFKHLFRRR